MKTKFKIKDLAAKPIDLELIHPKHGQTGIIIKMVGPHSVQWTNAFKEYKEGDPDASLKLMAATVIGWDDEAFEVPYTPEAVEVVLKDPANEWITDQIVKQVRETAAFFQ